MERDRQNGGRAILLLLLADPHLSSRDTCAAKMRIFTANFLKNKFSRSKNLI